MESYEEDVRMRLGLNAVVLGARQQEKRLEVIANNLANTGTAGYKKDNVHFRDFIYQSTYTRMDQGNTRSTGQPLDISLSGEGFLRVQTDKGILYTREGNLTLNQDNVLVTHEGWPVLGEGGPLTLTGSDIRIERDGQIFGRDESGGSASAEYVALGKLDLVEFPEQTLLEKAQKGCFVPRDPNVQPVPAQSVAVQQGALEEANFNPVEEMAHMIDTQRVYESYQKALQMFQQEDSQLISKLGGQ